MATRLELRTKARLYADQDGADFPSDPQYNLYLDDSAKEVLMELVMGGWQMHSTTYPLVSGGIARQEQFGFPTDLVLSVIQVYTTDSTGFNELKRVNQGLALQLQSQNFSFGNGFQQFYDLFIDTAGQWIEIFPRRAGTYFIDYIPGFPGFVNDASVWNGPTRSDDLIALKTAAKAVKKEGRLQDAVALKGEYEELLAKVKLLSRHFDLRNSPEIKDDRQVVSQFGFPTNDLFAGPGGIF